MTAIRVNDESWETKTSYSYSSFSFNMSVGPVKLHVLTLATRPLRRAAWRDECLVEVLSPCCEEYIYDHEEDKTLRLCGECETDWPDYFAQQRWSVTLKTAQVLETDGLLEAFSVALDLDPLSASIVQSDYETYLKRILRKHYPELVRAMRAK